MKDIVIVGSGGFGREVAWLIEEINKKKEIWNILGFIDDAKEIGETVGKYQVIGNLNWLSDKSVSAVCAIGDPLTRNKVITSIDNKKIEYPVLIHPSVLLSDSIEIGEGTIICAGSILTVDIKIGEHVIINLDSTIGHDVILENFVTILPSVNISGGVKVEHFVSIGTNSSVIQNLTIGINSTIGAGSTVIRDISKNSVAVGTPAQIIKYKHYDASNE